MAQPRGWVPGTTGEWPNRATLFTHGETMLRQVGDPETIMWYNGILVPISRAVGDVTFGITIDVSDEEGIAQAALEQTIRETVRQIRARAGLSAGGDGMTRDQRSMCSPPSALQ
jgi:hypothetical protein